MKAYAFSLGSESCTRSLQGENSLSLGLPGAAGSAAGVEAEEEAQPRPRGPLTSTAGEGPRAGPPLRSARHGRCLRRAALGPRRPGERGAGAGRSSRRREEQRGLFVGAPEAGAAPLPPLQDSPFAAAILFPAPAATAPRPGPRPGPRHPLARAPHPRFQRPLRALPVAILCAPPPPPLPPSPAQPPFCGRSLPPSPLGRARPPEPARSPS